MVKIKIVYLATFLSLIFLVAVCFFLFYLFKIDFFPLISSLIIILVIFYLKQQTNSFFSPASVFFGFYWLMLIGRSLISSFNLTDADLVSASSYNATDVGYVNLIILSILTVIVISFILIDIFLIETFISFPVISFRKSTKIILILIFLLSGINMLKDGLAGYNALKSANYIDLIESGELVPFSQISYTLLKWSWLFLFIAFETKAKPISILFLVFLCALPMTGMRGYFIIYVLLVLVFLDAKKAISLKLTFLIPFIFVLLTVTTLLLEYRLGFKVSGSGFFDPFLDAIFSQGATYEVVYGAFVHDGKISFLENALFPTLFHNPPYGTQIDILRGISNGVEDIGFGTSTIAELISGGPVAVVIYSLLLGVALKVLNSSYKMISNGNGFYFILFFLSPIIWGQPRGSLIQFVVKFGFFIFLIVIFHLVKLKKIRL